MARVKSGVTTRNRHKKVLSITKGHRAGRNNLYKKAHESMLHALSYATIHRRDRKGDMRKLWITRINAAARSCGVTYGQFMSGLRENEINLNRKILADMAVRKPKAFSELVDIIKG